MDSYTLHQHENSQYLFNLPGHMLVTFFNKEHPKAKNPVELIRTRVLLILEKNPWLTYRLVADKVTPTSALSLEKPAFTPNYNDFLFYESSSGPFDETDVLLLSLKLQKYNIHATKSCINNNVNLFKVSLIQNPKKTCLCLILAINQSLADAYTAYQIYRMLDPNQMVLSLNRITAKL